MRRLRLTVMVAALGAGCAGRVGQTPAVAQTAGTATEEAAAERKARVAEEHWLALVDAGRWNESWKEASTAFRKAVPEEKWVAGVEQVREPLGKVLRRDLLEAKFSRELPGVPDGQYVVSQFETGFEKKAYAVETVVTQVDTDGTWRISGYYVK